MSYARKGGFAVGPEDRDMHELRLGEETLRRRARPLGGFLFRGQPGDTSSHCFLGEAGLQVPPGST